MLIDRIFLVLRPLHIHRKRAGFPAQFSFAAIGQANKRLEIAFVIGMCYISVGDFMIKIIVCDDKKKSLERIREFVYDISKKLKRKVEVYTYQSGREVNDLLCKQKSHFDLLLLDIDMPEVSGFDIAREMRQAESDTVLIFISSHEHYVFKSIEYRPFRYIRKQYLEEELYHALKDAYKLIDSESDKTIIIKVDDEDIRLKRSEIMYYEIESRKLSIHLKNKNVLNIRKTIRDFYKELADDNFIQINSGCVVNAKYIDKISSNDITLENGEKLIVSRPRIKNVKSELLEYWGNKI